VSIGSVRGCSISGHRSTGQEWATLSARIGSAGADGKVFFPGKI
jgi:hypothetical protein